MLIGSRFARDLHTHSARHSGFSNAADASGTLPWRSCGSRFWISGAVCLKPIEEREHVCIAKCQIANALDCLLSSAVKAYLPHLSDHLSLFLLGFHRRPMARSSASTILICTALSLFLLYLLASLPSRTPHRHRYHHHHRRLKLRHNISVVASPLQRHIPFDPVIADIELRSEDRQWEREHFPIPNQEPQDQEPEWEDFFNPDDYVDDDDRFNITHRIVILFPSIDVAPADGFVTLAELAEWNFQQAVQLAIHRSGLELQLRDSNKDGFVSFEENQQYVKSLPADDMGWWKEDHFNASDSDGNGLLNLTEFNDFLHPADSSNKELVQWLCREEIRQKDTDEDGKLNFEEYLLGLFDSVQDYGEAYNHSDASELGKKLFSQLDKDNDGFLSSDELIAVIGKIHHSERYHAKQQADYALPEADSDKDGRLTLEEMIQHPYVFYNSIYSDDEDDNDFYDDYHDELR
ncbi:reticulocalbin-2-like [Canna indica]|uniref:Reticulocalbin-2-like n=1 Tax=Canna indica TaxID=4628 RepID=A0AAQ3Q4H9_9LILI|nr:reticulocalbin-2-like [Canna indica]